MQGSKHLLAPPGATPEVLKLIKEDHFACNHEDVLSSLGPSDFMREQEPLEPGSRPDRSVHPNVRTHILAAIRLFTCQRAPISLRRRALRVRRRKIFSVRCRSEGRGIIAGDPTLSIGWREKFPHPAERRFLVPIAFAIRGWARFRRSSGTPARPTER